jgi:hypothetical protein
MNEFKMFVGLDVHKDTIAIAAAKAGSRAAPRFVGTTRHSVLLPMQKRGHLPLRRDSGGSGRGFSWAAL